MIEKLYATPITDKYDNCYGTRNPSSLELMDKINEIIDYLNNKEHENKNEI